MGVAPGDVLYIAYLDDRRLHLLGRLPVEEILSQEQAERRFGERLWEAREHAVGDDGDIGVFDVRVADDVVRGLRFEREDGKVTTLNVAADGSVDGRALQSVRRLSSESASLLDEILDDESADAGGRRRISAAQRRAVELRAMEIVRQAYEARGWVVEDVSAYRPYDLVCRRDADLRHVEVKGVSGPGVRVELTRNEVEHARTCPAVALAVVAGITVSDGEKPQGQGGLLDLRDPWDLDEKALRATAYTYALASTRAGEADR
jgi:hypothetical protein